MDTPGIMQTRVRLLLGLQTGKWTSCGHTDDVVNEPGATETECGYSLVLHQVETSGVVHWGVTPQW